MARILAVDDDPDIPELVSAHFEGRGHEVIASHSGEDAVRLATEKRPHLVLLDFCMPKQNGAQVIEKLRADDATYKTPILVTSAAAPNWVCERLPLDSRVRFIAKPIDFRQLTAIVDEMIRENGGAKD